MPLCYKDTKVIAIDITSSFDLANKSLVKDFKNICYLTQGSYLSFNDVCKWGKESEEEVRKENEEKMRQSKETQTKETLPTMK